MQQLDDLKAAMERYLGINEIFELRFERYLAISYAAMCVCSDLKSLLKVEGKMELSYQKNKALYFLCSQYTTPFLELLHTEQGAYLSEGIALTVKKSPDTFSFAMLVALWEAGGTQL
jgi:hypothetical protein